MHQLLRNHLNRRLIFLLVVVKLTASKTCEQVTTSSLGEITDQTVQRCSVWDTSQHDDIPSGTDALWLVYLSNHSVHLGGNSTFSTSLPELKLLISDVTHLKEADFQSGAFDIINMTTLESFMLVRDLNTLPRSDRYFSVLNETFDGLMALEHLYMQSLGIHDIQADAFRGLHKLQSLSLSNNWRNSPR